MTSAGDVSPPEFSTTTRRTDVFLPWARLRHKALHTSPTTNPRHHCIISDPLLPSPLLLLLLPRCWQGSVVSRGVVGGGTPRGYLHTRTQSTQTNRCQEAGVYKG